MIDLEIFTVLTEEKIDLLTIIKRLGFMSWPAKYRELKPLVANEKSTKYSVINFQKKNCEIIFDMFPTAGGYYSVSIKQPGYFANDIIHVDRYFELYDPESLDIKCFELNYFKGSIEEQVKQSLICINRILEERFVDVLKGEEWLDIPPSFYDYK